MTTEVIEVEIPGIQGPKGEPGITVSETAPTNPSENDLWVDISED